MRFSSQRSTVSVLTTVATILSLPWAGTALAEQSARLRNHVEILADDTPTLERAEELIAKCSTRLHMETFLLNGAQGSRMVDALASARRNIPVDALIDGQTMATTGVAAGVLNPQGLNGSYELALAKAGIEIRHFSKSLMPSHLGMTGDHAKLLVCEGEWAIMGGTNFDVDVNHDANLLICGPSVDVLTGFYASVWTPSGATPFASSGRKSDWSHCAPANASLTLVTNTHGDSPLNFIVDVISSAKQSIWVQMFGLSSGPIETAILKKFWKNKEVQIMVHDNLAQGVFAYFNGTIPNSGAYMRMGKTEKVPFRVYRDAEGRQLHSKIALIDCFEPNTRGLVGSMNFTPAEMTAVHDYMALIEDAPEVTRTLCRTVFDDWRYNGVEVQ